MIPHFQSQDEQKQEELMKAVDLQKEHGGRLIAYVRFWSLIFVTVHQTRIVWVRPGGSRFLAGLPHSAFTLFLGIWAVVSIFVVPIAILRNSLGGTDVAEFYSTSMTDPMRFSPPLPGTAAREDKRFQRTLVIVLCLLIAGCAVFIAGYLV